MAISLSPSVTVKEQDLTLVTPAVSTSIGAFAGAFRWGPINEPKIVDTENHWLSSSVHQPHFAS